eukprot:CAMPEP_0175143796 /NCGR_PEP_ID=MMETSP0087-20121206/13701_1 /TAXON_ID=136419 /ORGANISM="Unknown Unknown, Strain D1" /LENGTH=174 /DNA_ID=CAMNT_0016428045 /DNA_START=75 /DNA_END=600 /DNA_ORIENTATION=+
MAVVAQQVPPAPCAPGEDRDLAGKCIPVSSTPPTLAAQDQLALLPEEFVSPLPAVSTSATATVVQSQTSVIHLLGSVHATKYAPRNTSRSAALMAKLMAIAVCSLLPPVNLPGISLSSLKESANATKYAPRNTSRSAALMAKLMATTVCSLWPLVNLLGRSPSSSKARAPCVNR